MKTKKKKKRKKKNKKNGGFQFKEKTKQHKARNSKLNRFQTALPPGNLPFDLTPGQRHAVPPR